MIITQQVDHFYYRISHDAVVVQRAIWQAGRVASTLPLLDSAAGNARHDKNCAKCKVDTSNDAPSLDADSATKPPFLFPIHCQVLPG